MAKHTISLEIFHKIAKMTNDIAGIYMHESKINMLSNRLRKRLIALNIETFEEYYHYLVNGNDPDEINQMLNVISTNETHFFRSKAHFEALEKKIIPELLSKRDTPVKILSAGCSSGEEPYSIAILLAENNWLSPKLVDLEAVDLNSMIIDHAKKGIYHSKQLRYTDERIVIKYFNLIDHDSYQIKNFIKNSIKFYNMNLLADKFNNNYDIIFCRNVMIYFNRENHINLVNRFYEHMNQDGFLIIGHAESLFFIKNMFQNKVLCQTHVYQKT
ncbi:MAG: protein-glutamate O-methyltransferase CheR [Spirochaetes bacterium]|nr:protein-glutamate O-methyltransferase CheR [Spirochaetota bacterium]